MHGATTRFKAESFLTHAYSSTIRQHRTAHMKLYGIERYPENFTLTVTCVSVINSQNLRGIQEPCLTHINKYNIK